ncbi:ras GTPase-activating protein 1-like [Watersipora subatra]|uniref:ras GTPase-activating protein 1-like n=1 Tax=Watersipora subatra TaxID=2589382 RepID=UPI00355B276B
MATNGEEDLQKESITLRLEGPQKTCWYHGRLSRKGAEKILTEFSKPQCFLVRESMSNPGAFVLSYLGAQPDAGFSHFRITSICGEYYIGGREFASLDDLVAYYTDFSELLPGEKLLHPVPPEKGVNDVRYVRAMLPYREKIPDTDELEFERDDVFTVCNELGDGWLWAVNQRTGDRGIIYSDLVTDIHDDEGGELIEDLEYYHASIALPEVKEILSRAGDRSFLLRPSDSTPGDFTLCFYEQSNLNLHRFKIVRHGKGFLMGSRFFPKVSDIITRYSQEAITPAGDTLEFPVRANRSDASEAKSKSQLEHVYRLMRQSSAGVNLIGQQRVMEGYLYMRKADKASKKQKRLFFVLKGDLQHLYYIENPKRSKPDGMIDLNYTSLYPVHETWLSRQGCIQLESTAINHYQIYYLWSDTEEESQRWRDSLKPYCKNTKTTGRTAHGKRGVREIYTLTLKVVEVKHLTDRISQGSVYCCNICLNEVAVAKTQTKDSNNLVWDEEFVLDDIPANVETFTIKLCCKNKKSGGKDPELFQVSKVLADVEMGEEEDDWMSMSPISTSNNTDSIPQLPHIRLKIQFKHDVILPVKDYNDLQKVLLSKDCQIVSTLGLLCDSRSDQIQLAQSLLKVFRHEKREATLLKTLTSVEIANEENAATLFRSTSLATTLMDQYMKLTAGDFVREALQKTVQRITVENIKIELDPNIMDNPAGLEANKYMLMQLLGELLVTIINAKNSCPEVLRDICGCLQRTVSKQWPDNEIVKPRVVSGFIFLRLLCPALVNPRSYNLVVEPPAESATRTLKLVAKSLINLANLVEVGTKELYMEAVGPFIVDNKNRMVTFLNELADVREISEQEKSRVDTDDVARELSTIHKICFCHIKQLQSKSITQPALKKLVAAIQSINTTIGYYSGHMAGG